MKWRLKLLAKATIKLLNKILDNNIDSKEINHILTAIQFQDKSGLIEGGLDRKIMAYDGSMSERHQYNVIDNLIKVGIYELIGKDLHIPDNNFLDEDGKEDYSTNNYIELPSFIHEQKFLNCSVLAKRLILHLLVNRILTQPVTLSIKTYIKWLGVNRPAKFRDVSLEIDSLDYFNVDQIWVNEELFITTKFKREFTGTNRLKTSRNSENLVRNMLKKKKLYKHVNPVVFRDFVQLFNEYKAAFVDCIKFLNTANLKGAILRTIIRKHLASN